MSQNKVKVTVLDSVGAKDIPVGIPPSWTVEKFVAEFKRKLNYPADAQYCAELKRTESVLNPQDTIEKAGIQDGDIIRLRHQPRGGQ